MYCPVAGIDSSLPQQTGEFCDVIDPLAPYILGLLLARKKLNNYQPSQKNFLPPFLSSFSDVFFFTHF